MSAAQLVEFRRRIVALAGSKGKSIARLAAGPGISESCLRRWVRIADVEEGVLEGATPDERAELVRLRRENRVQAAEVQILRQSSTCFTGEVVGPRALPGDRPPCRHRDRRGPGSSGAARLTLWLLRAEEQVAV